MGNKTLDGVKDTLFIPLMARIEISKRFPQYFYDQKAISLEKNIPSNIITQKSSEYTMLASASRAKIMDITVEKFICKQEKVNVVCIGCGLETMAWRLSDYAEKTTFYEMDFPDVIEKRKAVIGRCENEVLIEGNANEINFAEYMDCSLPTIFVVAGVFQYFKEAEVLGLINKLQHNFANAQILFDATDEFGIKYAARYVKKTGNKSAMMYFFINDPTEFAKKSNTTFIEVKGFYTQLDKQMRSKLKLYTRLASKIADSKMHAMILLYKL